MNEHLDLSSITLDDLIDSAILSHGFLPFKRDYYFLLETFWQAHPFAGQYLLVFKHCYEMSYQVEAPGGTLLKSWDDCFTNMDDYKKAGEPEGYIWGINSTLAYPGFSYLADSEKADEWTHKLNKQMREVKVEAEILKLRLIFHEWTLKKLDSDFFAEGF